MRTFKTYLLVLFFSQNLLGMSPSYKNSLQAIEDLLSLDGSEIDLIIEKWEVLEQIQDPSSRYLFKKLKTQQWGNQISDFLSLADLIFSFESQTFQDLNISRFGKARNELDKMRTRLNSFLLTYHPGYQLEHQDIPLGDSITIAVFDVFDTESMDRQRDFYKQASIESVKVFGDPVSMSHGNSVIDVILSVLPNARIVPISSDSKHYHSAFSYMQSRDDIRIINMSRAFAENQGSIDENFDRELSNVLRDKVVVKSLGNTGTDLFGQQAPERVRRGLPPLNSLFAYDLELIRSFLDHNASSLLVFAINLDLFAEVPSETATVPGDHERGRYLSLSAPADGVFSFSTGNFEQGSSFAAPQLSALIGLVWSQYPDLSALAVLEAVRKSSRALKVDDFEVGRGLPDGVKTLSLLQKIAG